MQEIRRFKPSTVSRRFSVAAGFYRTCVIDGLLQHSPAEHVRRPSVPPESPTLGFTHLQIEALLTAARQSPNPYDFALVAMLGLRIFEATGANIGDLGEEHGHRVLRVCGKGTKTVLSSAILAALVGAVSGAITGGSATYLVWRLQRPTERADALVREKMRQRWDAAQELQSLLSELLHGSRHIQAGTTVPYIELGKQFRNEARRTARKHEALLGSRTQDLIYRLTDQYAATYSLVEGGVKPDDSMFAQAQELDEATRREINEQLKSPMHM